MNTMFRRALTGFSPLAVPRRYPLWLCFWALMLWPHSVTCAQLEPNSSQPAELRGVEWETLSLYAPQQPMRRVRGIVCDNGPSVPEDRQSYVLISLPSELDAQKPVSFHLGDVTDSGSVLIAPPDDSAGGEANGRVVITPGQHDARYYPPDEFNRQQQRDEQGNIDITRAPFRSIQVLIRGQKKDGAPCAGKAVVTLVRPTVVLVHGINNNASNWEHRPFNNGLGISLKQWQFDTIAVNHGIDDLEHSSSKAGAAYFKGNGPVEFGAARLEDAVQATLRRYETMGVVGQRVDIVAHSYGGLISRWYIKTHSPPAPAPIDGDAVSPTDLGWYTKSHNQSGEKGIYNISAEVLQRLRPRSDYHHVRKLITIASPWRGTPIANVVNELHSPATSQEADLGRARLRVGRVPLLRLQGLAKFSDAFLSSLIATRVPSVEVLAVDSPWLQALNVYPFRSDISYEAIAGTNNAYVRTPWPTALPYSRIDLFSTLHEGLRSNVLPVLELERVSRRRMNLTDGIVPVWSAVIEPRSKLIFTNHKAALWDDELKTYVAGSLSDSGLSGGTKLNERWSQPWSFTLSLPAEGYLPPDQRTWKFASSIKTKDTVFPPMAPLDRAYAYSQFGGVARISPSAIYPLRNDKSIQRVGKTGETTLSPSRSLPEPLFSQPFLPQPG